MDGAGRGVISSSMGLKPEEGAGVGDEEEEGRKGITKLHVIGYLKAGLLYLVESEKRRAG